MDLVSPIDAIVSLEDAQLQLENCFSLELETETLTIDEYCECIEDILLDAIHASTPYPEYADNPIGFLKDILNVKYLTPEQEEICISVRDKVITNVKAGASLGKSFVAACLVLWYVFSVGGRVVTTAPTENQVDEILWSEIRELYDANQEKLGGRRGRLFLRLNEQARAVGLVAADNNANSFHGKHAHKLLLIEDEACGISKVIDDAALACITGGENRLLRIGNPISDGNSFSEACAIQSITIPSWNHPNVAWAYRIDPIDGIHRLKPEIADRILKPESEQGDNPVQPQHLWPDDLPRDEIPGAVSINWIEMIRRQKTENSAYWQSRIEAHFPEDADKSIVPRSWFRAARARYDADPAYWDRRVASKLARHGLDVGDGSDPHAWAYWRGCVLYAVAEKQTLGDRLDVPRAADWGIAKLKENHGSIAVDQIGVGSGALGNVLEYLNETNRVLGLQCWAAGVNFGKRLKRKKHAPDDEIDVINVRAQEYWAFREACRLDEIAIAPLGEWEERAIEEFAKIYYEETHTGQTKIEDKSLTRKRLKRSPNLADAIVMGFIARTDTRVVNASHGALARSKTGRPR